MRTALRYGMAMLVALIVVGTASAAPVDEPLPDPAQEAVARAIMEDVRCLVCQNQAISDSNADMAQDLRAIIREQVVAGNGPDEVRAFLQERYGDWVLFDPPFSMRTFLLWYGPFIFLGAGALGMYWSARHRQTEKAGVSDSAPRSKKSITSVRAPSPMMIVAFACGLLLLAIVMYVQLGQWNVADRPAAGGSTTDQDSEMAARQQELQNLMAALRARLESDPDSEEGWQHMVRLASGLSDYGAVAQAYGELARLNPGEAQYLIGQTEALIRRARGMVTPAARLVMHQAAELEPGHPAVRYYEGLWQLQQGDELAALDVWQALLDDSEESDPWVPQLRSEVAKVKARRAPPAAGVEISPETMAQVSSMSQEEQLAFIESMVARLRERLESTPEDVEGWLRLARAEEQIGHIPDAVDALTRAREFAGPDRTSFIASELRRLQVLMDSQP